MDKSDKNNSAFIIFKRYMALILFLTLTGMGAAISLKAKVGVGAWDAMVQSMAYLSGIRVGTMGMILNISCVIGQIIILKRDFKWINLLQIPMSIILGMVVNLFLYDVFGNLELNNYILRLILLILSNVQIALMVSGVMVLNIFTFPLEGLCMALSPRIGIKFSTLRQRVDILSIIISLLLTMVFSLPLSLREGSFISMLIFGPLLGFFIPRIRIIFKRWKLID